MKKLFLLFSLIFSISISAMDIVKSDIVETRKISRSPGMLNLASHILSERKKESLPTKKANKFVINIDGENKEIPSYLVDKELLKATPEQLQAFQDAGGKFDVIKYDNGEFGVKAMVPGKGGGPIGFAIGCYLGAGAVNVGANAAISAAEAAAVAAASAAGGPAGMAASGAIMAAGEGVRLAAQPAIQTASVKAGLGLGLTLMVLIPI
jgi:hypothetical protein